VLVAEAAVLQAGEEGPHRERRHLGDGGRKPVQPPPVGRQRGPGAAGDLLGQQEGLKGVVEEVSVGFFGPF
jgi:hypothetical protein